MRVKKTDEHALKMPLCPTAASSGKVDWGGRGKSQGPGTKKMLFLGACGIEQNPAKALGDAGLDLMVCPRPAQTPVLHLVLLTLVEGEVLLSQCTSCSHFSQEKKHITH